MKNNTDPKRNNSADKGRNDDPGLRDDSAIAPGADTISHSDTYRNDQQRTETGADSFREDDSKDPRADKTFDEVDYD